MKTMIAKGFAMGFISIAKLLLVKTQAKSFRQKAGNFSCLAARRVIQ